MSDHADENENAHLQIGSGDFQNNPIHGDYDMRPSYAEFGADPTSLSQYDPNATPSLAEPYNQSATAQQFPQNTTPQQFSQSGSPQLYTQSTTPHIYSQHTSPPVLPQHASISPPLFPQNTASNSQTAPQYLNNSQSLPPHTMHRPPQQPRPPGPAHSQTYGSHNLPHINNFPADREPIDVVAHMNQNIAEDVDEDIDDINCYTVSQPKPTDSDSHPKNQNGYGLFGNFLVRTMFISLSIFLCSLFSFPMWFQQASLQSFNTGFALSGFAVIILFIASIMSFIWALMTKLGRPIPVEKLLLWAVILLYVTGGLMYFIAACAVAYAWNSVKESSIAGVFFAEQTFVAIHAIFAGMDLWKRNVLNDKKRRVLLYGAVFILLCVVDFFAYAVTSNKLYEAGIDNAGAAWLALFYCVMIFPSVIYLIIFSCAWPALSDKLGKPAVYMILALVYIVCAVCVVIGYFIVMGSFEGFMEGRIYFFAFGLFVGLCATVNAFDMVFDRFVPGYKDGGLSVADQGVHGTSALATHDPDSLSADHY